MAIAHAHAEREPITIDPETQQHLFEIITPILAVPIGRPRWYGSLWRWLALGPLACLFLISPIQAKRGRILMEPGCRDGIHFQGQPFQYIPLLS